MTPERLAELRVLCAHGLTFAELSAARKAEARMAALPELLAEVERQAKALERLASASEMVLESHLKGYNLVKPMAVLSSNAVAARSALAAGDATCDHASFNTETGCCAVCGFNFAPRPLGEEG